MATKEQLSEQAPVVVQKAASERFTANVLKEFSSNVGEIKLSSFQTKLIQNYFIKLDRTLKDSEIKRQQKGQKADPTPITWENLNMPKLAQDVVALSLVGLDPLQPNHVNLIPYKNNSTGKYDITPLLGYRGMEIKTKKYALEIPSDIIVELVFSSDHFKEVKRSASNPIEHYEFEVKNSFERGELIGGFFYIKYDDKPQMNRLRVFNKAEIEKRKPKYASTEFWGGEKKDFNSGKTETVDGWYLEMAWKTVARAAYNSLTIDSEKIDDHFVRVLAFENEEMKALESRNASPIEEMRNEVNMETAAETVSFEEINDEKPVEKSEPVSTSDKIKGQSGDQPLF